MYQLKTLSDLRLIAPTGTVVRGRRELTLLAYLARRPNRMARRDALALLLWERKGEARARHSLRQALLELKRWLGGQLEVTSDSVALPEGVLDLDLDAFEAAVARTDYAQALALHERPFLEGLEDLGNQDYRVWVEAERASAELQLARARDALGESRPAPARRPGSAALLAPDLIGRAPILAELAAGLQQARQGQVSVLSIEGGEGTGKTRVLDTFVRAMLPRRDTLVLRARARAAQSSESLLAELLAPLRNAPGLSGVADADLAEVAELVPAVRERFPALPAAQAGARLRGIAQTLRDVSEEVALLVAIDDFHLLGDAQLRLLIEQSAGAICWLLSQRSAERREIQHSHRLVLRPLDEAESEAMLASMFELNAPDRRALAQRLHAVTGGVPLHLLEVVSALVDEGHITPGPRGIWTISEQADHLPLPSSTRAALGRRIEQLSPTARSVLGAAALAGESFEPRALRLALPPALLSDALSELVTRRFLRKLATTYEFTHGSMRTAALAGVAASKPPRRRAWLIAAALLLAIIPTATLLLSDRTRAADTNFNATRVAVFPFRVRGPQSIEYLGEGIVPLLSAAVDGAGPMQAVDPNTLLRSIARDSAADSPDGARQLARNYGAGLTVLGAVIGSADRLQITAEVYDWRGRRIATLTTAAGSENQVFALVDELARKLIATQYTNPQMQLQRVAAVTTTSVPALRHFLAGERALRRGEFAPAWQAYQLALQEDSTFALAWYRLSHAAGGVPDHFTVARGSDYANRLRHKLPMPERLLMQANRAQRMGETTESEKLYRQLLDLRPSYALAWEGLGELVFHGNANRGASFEEARDEFVRLLQLEPGDQNAIAHLARIAAFQRDQPMLDSLVRRLGRKDLDRDPALEVRAAAALIAGRTADPVLAEILALPPQRLWDIGWRVSTFTENLRFGERVARQLARHAAPDWKAAGHLMHAHLLAAAGRTSDALLQVAHIERLRPDWAVLLRTWLTLNTTTQADSLRLRLTELSGWNGLNLSMPELDVLELHDYQDFRPLRAVYQAHLAILLDDEAQYRQALRSLQSMHTASAPRIVAAGEFQLARARAAHQGRWLDVLAEMPGPLWGTNIVGSPFYDQAHSRMLKADALMQLGRVREAVSWYRSCFEDLGYALIHHLALHQRLARAYRLLGDEKAARQEEARANALRS